MRFCEIQRLESMDFQGSEALNSICTNLSFVGRDMKSFVVTSCTENEGKSSLVMQIMRNLAARKKKVVVVDCDLRKSVMLSHFNIRFPEGEINGLAQYLAGYSELEDVVYGTNIQDAYLIPAGKDIVNPIPLLDSQEFTQLIDQLKQSFDVVLIDAPPIGMVVDSAVIARRCDGVILVISHAQRRRGEVQDAVKQIHQSGCPVVGCIINRVNVKTRSQRNYYKNHYYSYSHYSNYGNGYGYGKEENLRDGGKTST
ncbi:MAG: CpsD/CapB family tyrosine-protein kinase [Clostridia bacterium]|nr:CpsD/CapB family tyrosine-protein kinase [Clostridia bacterium]